MSAIINAMRKLALLKSISPAGDHYEVAKALNKPSIVRVYPRPVRYVDMIGELGAVQAGSIMAALEASQDDQVRVVAAALRDNSADLGAEGIRELLSGSGIDGITDLLGMAERLISPAENAGLPYIRAGWVLVARGDISETPRGRKQ